MGIINVTPDSFSDGGQFYKKKNAIKHAKKLIADGADIIDIGGESSRPGAKRISEEEEINRVIPVINQIRIYNPDILISVDTMRSKVAQHAIKSGADIINDISGLSLDKEMANIVSNLNVPVIIMHMKGTPKNMQMNPTYKNLINEIISFFKNKIKIAVDAGIKKENIILDPGIGFGKSVENNFELICKLKEFYKLGFPIMIGPSRKSFIGITLDLPPTKRIEGTSAAVTAGIINGARIVRVHDVKEIRRVVTITEKIRSAL